MNKNRRSTRLYRTTAWSAVLLLGVALTGCSPKEIFPNPWQSSVVHVDGDPSEWEVPLKLYDESTQLSYTLSNDDQNLYVCVRAANEKTQQQIMRGGMQLWIDTTGKKNQQSGIRYPSPTFQKPPEGSSRSTSVEKKDKDKDSKSFHEMFLSQNHEMLLTGFPSPVSNGSIPLQNIYGLKVSLNWDSSGIMVYEAAIPLKLLCQSPFSTLKKNKKRTFGFSITTNVIPAPMHNSSSGKEHQNSRGSDESGGGSGGSGMRGSGGGGMRGGGMRGGGMRGGGGNRGGSESRSEDNEPKTFWMQFELADKK